MKHNCHYFFISQLQYSIILFIGIFAFEGQVAAQDRKGQILIGKHEYDQYGISVAISDKADRVAITGKSSFSLNSPPYTDVFAYNTSNKNWQPMMSAEGSMSSAVVNQAQLVRLSSDGTRMIITRPEKVVYLQYNSSNSRWEVKQNFPMSHPIRSIGLSSDGSRLWISSDNKLVLYNYNVGQYVELSSGTWSPDFMSVALGDGFIFSKISSKELDISGNRFTRKQYGAAVAISDLKNRAVAVNTVNNSLETFNFPFFKDQPPSHTIPNFAEGASSASVDLSFNGSRLAVSRFFGGEYFTEVYNWVNNQWELYWQYKGVGGGEVDMTSDGSHIIVGTPWYFEGDVRVHRVDVPSSSFEVNENPLKVFPNPTNGILNIEDPDIVSIQIFDQTGRVVISQELDASMINVAELSDGFYVIQAISNSKVLTTRFIKN